MVSKEARLIIVFLFFLFSTQWFLILFQNHSLLTLKNKDLIFARNQVFLDETNTLRGETIKNGNGLMGRLFVNKFTIYGQEMISRYLESFDPNYLFFTGGVDRVTSTGSVGQLPLSFLPLIIFGVYTISKLSGKRRAIAFLLIMLSPALSMLFFRHYEWLPKVVFFFVLTATAAYGLVNIPHSKKYLIALILFFWLFETVGLYHKFKNHYVQELATQIYNIKRK